MLKQWGFPGLFTMILVLAPASTVLADENGNGGSLSDGPFVIVAFATLIVMAYYMIRE
ncbi:hypothetical protein [Salisediminibacterium halotolerans]|uniref:Uncharacterized protein n=1 Tax=Salisediminibacterium halotolerans TaxID=517425 RepID=A0A1H9RV64_9BACI|nr:MULTISPECIES: hypothetical protein [Salisediminibacterium]RLJ74094.1 hypothetical protein BCL39_1379 [Actinophytocola xinjiangensis]RPE87813.1 hypothetical protein EDD67_1552 [Salisediminibacterium halotolerans]TWG34931.1 hypothetical protein BCL52_1376 [Salisediminibacterium halotolerans]SER76468.1 hypothetical protein SAMN05444126_105106 [Salisediminibacterium haloalkalitolerans]GEL08238.1 hypothetical protein SHA02_16540 [Salisediminibacterium halotolerans]